MEISAFLNKLKSNPEAIEFTETMAVIEENYDFTPVTFANGETENPAGQNSGSCKLFAFARLHDLNEKETLACFGVYYRQDVLKHPEGSDHQNIRNFMKTGWEGIRFEGEALKSK